MRKHDTLEDIVAQHLYRIFIYRCLFNHNSDKYIGRTNDPLWYSILIDKDVDTILYKLSLDPELSRKVEFPLQTKVFGWTNNCKKWLRNKELTYDLITRRYYESISYINRVLDYRNPIQGRQSEIDALIRGGFYPEPRIK